MYVSIRFQHSTVKVKKKIKVKHLKRILAIPATFVGYVHTVTFLHGFVFHNPKGIPIYFQTIENDAKTLPCAHSRYFILQRRFYAKSIIIINIYIITNMHAAYPDGSRPIIGNFIDNRP